MPDRNQAHPAARELLDDAQFLGWQIRDHKSGGGRDRGWRLISPLSPDSRPITIDIPPVRQWNDGKLQAHRERLLRYSSPDKVEALQFHKQRQLAEHSERIQEVRDEEAKALAEAEQRAQEGKNAAPKPGPPRNRPTLQYTKDAKDEDPKVVSSKPWLVRHGTRGGGNILVYESHAVLRRNWSDGHVDFKCTRCDFVHANPLAVTTHYGRTAEGHPARTERAQQFEMDPKDYVSYTPVISKRPYRRRTPEQVQAGVVLPPVQERKQPVAATPAPTLVADEPVVHGDAQEILDKIIALVAPDSSEVEKLRKEVGELNELLTTAERERDEAEQARQAAEERAQRAASALSNFRKAFAALEEG